MVHYGNGFTWSEVYNMPVWLRKFYYKKIEEAILNRKKKTDPKKTSKPKISRPPIAPNS
jgi:hypothetical protein